jgi:hypothetical protein
MIQDGWNVDAAVTNAAFMSRTADTSTAGKVALENAGSDSLEDVQKDINDIFTAVGIDGEDDTAANTYANENYITNADSYKTCIEKLDAALDSHADATAGHGVTEVVGTTETQTLSNKTFSDDIVGLGKIYLGDPTTNGSWRFDVTSGNLSIEKRVDGSWEVKGVFE